MSVLKEFEREVVTILVGGLLRGEELAAVLEDAELAEYEYTGVGYFLTLCHPAIPTERAVCDEPIVSGRVGHIECGFVVFLQDGELTLECHSWGNDHVPKDFRDQPVGVFTGT